MEDLRPGLLPMPERITNVEFVEVEEPLRIGVGAGGFTATPPPRRRTERVVTSSSAMHPVYLGGTYKIHDLAAEVVYREGIGFAHRFKPSPAATTPWFGVVNGLIDATAEWNAAAWMAVAQPEDAWVRAAEALADRPPAGSDRRR